MSVKPRTRNSSKALNTRRVFYFDVIVSSVVFPCCVSFFGLGGYVLVKEVVQEEYKNKEAGPGVTQGSRFRPKPATQRSR